MHTHHTLSHIEAIAKCHLMCLQAHPCPSTQAHTFTVQCLMVTGLARLQEATGLWTFATPMSTLYSPDVPHEVASEATAALRPMAMAASTDVIAALIADWAQSEYKGCMSYIRCTQDATIPVELQDLMVKKSGGDWKVITLNTGHSPFLSHPEEVAKIIVSLAEAYTS